MVWRYAITILIRHPWYPQRYNFEREHGGHCTHDVFYKHQVPLSYMAVFRQAIFEPGPSDPELNAVPTRPPRPLFIISEYYFYDCSCICSQVKWLCNFYARHARFWYDIIARVFDTWIYVHQNFKYCQGKSLKIAIILFLKSSFIPVVINIKEEKEKNLVIDIIKKHTL